MALIETTKDETRARPVASAWRPVFKSMVDCFCAGDFLLLPSIPGVSAVAENTAQQIQDYLSDYGESLAPLPAATWSTSVSIWMGDHWDVLVDLYTEESGRSDMVLQAKVMESSDGFIYEIHSVYVP